MCGIAGFTGQPADADRIIAAMTGAMIHRGPQQEGFYRDQDVTFGHRRLVIIAPEGGEQPRVDGNRRDALVYNGEIFDYRSHLEALRAAGEPLRDNCDTEVLFATIRRYGVAGALERLDGAFAFAFQDGAKRTLDLAVDRMGEKPLYWSFVEGCLVFASELGALRRHPAVARLPLDPVAFARSLCFEHVPGPDSVIAGVHRLGAGQRLHYRDGEIRVEDYWQPRFVAARRMTSDEDRLRQLEDQLDRSIRARLIADVPVGVFLSGGVDSSLVSALAARHAPGIKAFTIRTPHADQDESVHAVSVARRLAIEHRIITLGDGDLLAALSAVEQRLDEPFGDSSLVPSFLVCQVAKSEVTVALGGDGADELLGGHPFLTRRGASRLLERVPSSVGRWLRGRFGAAPLPTRLRFRADQALRAAGETAALHPYLWLSAFDGQAIDAIATPAFRARLRGADLLAPQRALLGTLSGLAPAERLQSLWLSTYLPWSGAPKLDRAAMWNSFEIRAPFLARSLVDFCLALPARDRIRGSDTKVLLKRLAARHVPAEAVYRRKQGFVVPLAEYLRGPLRQRVEERLLGTGHWLSAWFDREAIARLWRDHQEGRADHRRALWGLYLAFGWAERTRPSLA